MSRQIAILHYASPPTVGGVEATIAYHARGLTNLGYSVRVVSGSGATFDPHIPTIVDPLFGSKHPDVLAVKAVLDGGVVPPEFAPLVQRQVVALRAALAGCDVCIVHNIHTLNKNLSLTAALAGLDTPRCIAWAHDLAWTNAQYQPELHAGYPWDLLRQAWADTQYVTVSEARRGELAALLKIAPESIHVITSGVDPAGFFRWTETTRRIVGELGLLDADGVLLTPARLTRRKNIELGLRVLAELRRQSGKDMRLVVTGPPGPHNPANPGYLGELLTLRQQLGLEGSAHFLYQLDDPPLVPDDETMADLYGLADALFFPSTQEGFGIPMLEAGLARLPAFAADIPPLRGTGGDDAVYFHPTNDPADAIAARILRYLNDDAAYRFRLRVRREYRWETIIKEQIVPLLGDLL